MHVYTTEELRERKALTDAVVDNLRIINADSNDLENLERRTSAIASNLRAINKTCDELASRIAESARGIEGAEDLDPDRARSTVSMSQQGRGPRLL